MLLFYIIYNYSWIRYMKDSVLVIGMLTKLLFSDGQNQTKALYLTGPECEATEERGYALVDGSSLSFRKINDSDTKLLLDAPRENYDQKEIWGRLDSTPLEKRHLSKDGEC